MSPCLVRGDGAGQGTASLADDADVAVRLAGGSLRTSSRTEVGRALMTNLQGECVYRRVEEEEGEAEKGEEEEEEEEEEEDQRRSSVCSQ